MVPDDAKVSEIGVNYNGITFTLIFIPLDWDFDNFEAKEYRLLQTNVCEIFKMNKNKRYPRYLNAVENYKFKYTYVDILFTIGNRRLEFSISVFDKPKDLKEKMAEISNHPELKNPNFLIRLQDKESYIYGDEILLDFESVNNALIKSKKLRLKLKERDNSTSHLFICI